MRQAFLALLWCAAGLHCGVEETGWLDPKITVTSTTAIGSQETTLVIAGEPQAVMAGDIHVKNLRSGQLAMASASSMGSFRTTLDGRFGDILVVTQEGVEQATLAVKDFSPFPELIQPPIFETVADDSQPRQILLDLVQRFDDGKFLAANANTGEVVRLIQGGQNPHHYKWYLTARASQTVQFWRITPDNTATLAIEAIAP